MFAIYVNPQIKITFTLRCAKKPIVLRILVSEVQICSCEWFKLDNEIEPPPTVALVHTGTVQATDTIGNRVNIGGSTSSKCFYRHCMRTVVAQFGEARTAPGSGVALPLFCILVWWCAEY